MPSPDLVAEFKDTLDRWNALGAVLVVLSEQLAIDTVARVLPEATVIEVRGEINEDWLRILRVRRVLSGTGGVLFDAAEGHDDPQVEAAVDQVNADCLDLLLDLTGDLMMGNHRIES